MKVGKEVGPIPPSVVSGLGEWERGQLGDRRARGERAPVRAVLVKGAELKAALRGGNVLDWADVHERYVDLWQEARLCIWRAKHRRVGGKVEPDDRTVLQAVEVTKGLLDSIVRLREKMGTDGRSGIPRWAVERIEKALRGFPDAQRALLAELAAEDGNEH